MHLPHSGKQTLKNYGNQFNILSDFIISHEEEGV